jgi:hypothetical protein
VGSATLVAFTVAYLAIHLTLYVVVLRDMPAFGSERVIFLYHAVPAVLLTVVVAVIVALDPTTLAAGVLAVSLQGLYSLSFLELWALSDGGYSLQILEHVASTGNAFDTGGLQEIGASKRSGRLSAALDLGLVEHNGNQFALTRPGRVISRVVAAVVWIVNAGVE